MMRLHVCAFRDTHNRIEQLSIVFRTARVVSDRVFEDWLGEVSWAAYETIEYYWNEWIELEFDI